MTKLLSCPFCGQQDAFVEQLDSDASVVICQGMVDEHSACLARGPVGVQQSDLEDQPGRDAAIAEWNRRAQPAEAEGAKPDAFEVARHSKRLVEQLRDQLAAVTAERDRLRKDAERYRWLRNPDQNVSLVLDKMTGEIPADEFGCGGYRTYEYRAGAELDDAIDAAMAAKEA